MTTFAYLISTSFRYDLVIAPDVGPPVAAEYGWPLTTLAEARTSNIDIVVVDSRASDQELFELRRLILDRPKTLFALRVVDNGFYRHPRRQPSWFDFLDEIALLPNTELVLTYSPSGKTFDTLLRRPSTDFVLAPYTYDTTMERPIGQRMFSRRMIISGRISKVDYPLRYGTWRVRRFSPFLRSFTDVIQHPGYPETGAAKAHNIVSDKYIDYLSRYGFAFVCSGADRREFLKYREIAYAGCAPIGDLPPSLADCPDDSFDVVGPPITLGAQYDLWRRVACSTDWALKAERFRSYMRQKRNRERLRSEVNTKLASRLRSLRAGAGISR